MIFEAIANWTSKCLARSRRVPEGIQPPRAVEPAPLDHATSLHNRDGFFIQGGYLLEACRTQGAAVSLAVFDFGDLIRRRGAHSGRIGRKVTLRIVTELNVLAGDSGIAAHTGPTQFTVAMLLDREGAEREIRRVLEKPPGIEADADDAIALVPEVVVGGVPDGVSIQQFHAVMTKRLAAVQIERANRLLHWRKGSRSAPPPQLPHVVAVHVPGEIPATMPMPLRRQC